MTEAIILNEIWSSLLGWTGLKTYGARATAALILELYSGLDAAITKKTVPPNEYPT